MEALTYIQLHQVPPTHTHTHTSVVTFQSYQFSLENTYALQTLNHSGREGFTGIPKIGGTTTVIYLSFSHK